MAEKMGSRKECSDKIDTTEDFIPHQFHNTGRPDTLRFPRNGPTQVLSALSSQKADF